MKSSIGFLLFLSLNVSAQATGAGNGPGNGSVADKFVITCNPIIQGRNVDGQLSTVGPAITREFERSLLNSENVLEMSSSYADTTIKLSIDSTSFNLSSPGDEPIDGKIDYQHGIDLSIIDNLSGNALEQQFIYYTFGNMELKNEVSPELVKELELAPGVALVQEANLKFNQARKALDVNNESIDVISLSVQCSIE